MSGFKLHLHSMVVHAVIALAVLAALGFVAVVREWGFGPVAMPTWAFLWRASLVLLLLAALPATLSGITERAHMYVNWHASHRAKLALSVTLLAMTAAELLAAATRHGPIAIVSWLGFGIVAGNPLVCLALSYYGLRISLGRQAIARLSYVPDMALAPPVDILAGAAAHVAERAKLTEVMEEAS